MSIIRKSDKANKPRVGTILNFLGKHLNTYSHHCIMHSRIHGAQTSTHLWNFVFHSGILHRVGSNRVVEQLRQVLMPFSSHYKASKPDLVVEAVQCFQYIFCVSSQYNLPQIETDIREIIIILFSSSQSISDTWEAEIAYYIDEKE